MTKEAKRIGRPTKAPTRGERVSLGLKVTADIKRRIDSAARASGRTQSQEAERRIELSYQYERALGELEQAKKTLAQMTEDTAIAELERLGILGSVIDPRYPGGMAYFLQDRRFPQSGWVDPNKESPPLPPGPYVPSPEFIVNSVKAMATEIARLKAALKKEGGQ
jgi:hypothetical protein